MVEIPNPWIHRVSFWNDLGKGKRVGLCSFGKELLSIASGQMYMTPARDPKQGNIWIWT